MRIDHTAIYVRDLERMKVFYETFFGGQAGALYHNPKTGLKTYFLSFAEGGRLELMTRPDMTEREKEPQAEGFIHLAFAVGGKERVDALTMKLKADGCKVVGLPRTTGDGYYESCVLDPEGNRVEIVA